MAGALRPACLVLCVLAALALLAYGMMLVWKKPAANAQPQPHQQSKGLSLMLLGVALGSMGLHLCKGLFGKM